MLWLQQGFEDLPGADQLLAVQDRIREHYRRTTGAYKGFGKILRYRWARTFDTSMVFDTDGNVVEANGGRMLLPEVWMALHG